MRATQATLDQRITYRGQWFVRVLGAILLSACLLMLVLGGSLLRDWLAGVRFALYWSWCFLLAIGTISAALLDLVLLRRASRRARRRLFREQFSPVRPSKP